MDNQKQASKKTSNKNKQKEAIKDKPVALTNSYESVVATAPPPATAVAENKPVTTPLPKQELMPPNDAQNTSISSREGQLYFTDRDVNRVLSNLEALKKEVFPGNDTDSDTNEDSQDFPSVCLIGLGRCGSNIALDVSTLVYNARRYFFNEYDDTGKQAEDSNQRSFKWIRKSLQRQSKTKPVFLIEPLVMLGDLDKDIKGRIQHSHQDKNSQFLQDYTKMKIMDLSEIHAGGAGNAPILGQYLAKIILNKDIENFSDNDWKHIHSYLIDSCGIKANQSRLYFYIFSAGGGTGSGMASEFGLAQQYAYTGKTFDTNPDTTTDSHHSFVFEPIFTCGICILPNISDERIEMSEALHINAGRLLCKYLSEEWDFSYNFDNEVSGEANAMQRIRPWNAMMLISNDIMRYAEETDDSDIQNIDVNSMEKFANQYISQQIFNILTAQSVTADYDKNYFHQAGIDIGETIRLDANDLFMSLAGPVAVAYAESVVSESTTVGQGKLKVLEKNSVALDIEDLFYRSIDLPHFNKSTQAIEGISLLPIEPEQYRKSLAEYKDKSYDATELRKLHFYQNCSSIVSIISLPKDYKLTYTDLNRLKQQLNHLFPNTTLKRYAIVIGASANLSLTTLIAKSPCLSDDFLTLLVAYVKRCFAKNAHRYNDTLDNTILECIRAETFNESLIDDMIDEFENPSKILDTNWFTIKPMYEKKYRELIQDKDKYVSINDIRLTANDVKNAIRYLREIYQHRISKTRIVSLNKNKVSLNNTNLKPKTD